jgi:hypothetical protein
MTLVSDPVALPVAAVTANAAAATAATAAAATAATAPTAAVSAYSTAVAGKGLAEDLPWIPAASAAATATVVRSTTAGADQSQGGNSGKKQAPSHR